MEQFEQLLTCCVCLDRYRNPKLLPCQHSFCMEPCMEGLVDYVRRQVKCPECRAEHRIPYQGIQGYPTNVTLQRFLELHIEITGEQPDPTSGQIMRRCAVCTEKAYCMHCAHCSKEVCPQCKAAHMDILRREITRINHQVRRSVGRLQDVLSIVEKNMAALQQNCGSVSEEIEEIYRRLSKAVKDRTDYLREEIGRYQTVEMKNLTTLKDNMEMEISNIESNCDLADKHMQSEDVEWEDCELLDTKEIFLKTIDFLRHFEADLGDYSRRVRFVMTHDPNQLVMHVATYGELNIHMPHQFIGMTNNQQLQAPGPGLMRSKSDHRLTAQYRQQDDRYDRGDPDGGRVSPLGGRKFGERYERRNAQRQDRDYDDYEERPSARSRIRSRLRHHNADTDSDNDTTGRSVRFSDPAPPQRDRAIDTEDVAKGPLSGITRLYDSPRVMKKLQDAQIKKDKPPTPVPEKPKVVPFQPPKVKPAVPVTQRQVSEEDEIAKVKRQMKNAPGERPDPVQERPGSERVSALRREEEPSSPTRTSPQERQSSVQTSQVGSGSEESDEGSVPASPASPQRKTAPPPPPQVRPQSASSRRSSTASSTDTHPTTGNSRSDNDTNISQNSDERQESAETGPSQSDASRNTGAAYTTEELKLKLLERRLGRPSGFQSRFLKKGTGARTGVSTPPREKTKEEEESSSEEETSSEESESEEEQPAPKPVVKPEPEPVRTREPPQRKPSRDETTYTQPSSRWGSSRTTDTTDSSPSSYRPLYGRERPQPQREESPPSYIRTRPTATTRDDDDTTPHSRYGERAERPERPGGFTSRFLNKSKSSAAVSPEEEDPGPTRRFGATTSASSSAANTSPRSRYSALKDRKARLARSKSSHALGDEDEEDESLSPSAYLASRYDLARSRSSHQVKSREASPEPTTRTSLSSSASGLGSSSAGSSGAGTSGEKDGAALSSWARYLKNKYGARGKEPGQVSATNSRRLSLGLPLRQDSDHDESKNSLGSPTSPTQHQLHQGFGVGSSTRCPYLTKRRQVFSVGSRGSEPGCFTWPRGVAVSPDNHIVVADSSNHRVQVFDSNGIFQKEFGQYGNGEGEFDCLAGVAVNRIGQFIIADRYNHRIQVMDPSGRFLRSFGSQGTQDGRFNYPWGVTTDALGFIYVCDKENHRVQVFQSDGTFVGKFGTQGNKIGQLDHPHYIAVSNTNKVIVSDSNNHRIQIFDVNGRVLSSFGQEGSDEGQFKFPRGVAVDDQGYILVGDSGNNRIQVFSPDGVFMRGFGSWGSGDGEFKGLEGVAVMANSSVLVCDRENHRIQVF